MAPTTFDHIEVALDEAKSISEGIFHQEPHVEKVIAHIRKFAEPYRRRNLDCRAWVEVLMLKQQTVSVNPIRLESL